MTMDTTFITIHDLSPNARVLYSSDSIVDILGHTPDEVVGRSCWDFFHPDELPLAKAYHSRGVTLDKAAVLAYCRLLNRQYLWVGCECCFSIVYDVMVCCTSVYRRGMSSQKRAVEAPIVRKLFASSPLDPRYHMLSHLSNKFKQGPEEQTHEPRAALFLNRFTRTLTIMYATTGIKQIIGISGEVMKGRSFYYCIQENCLEDAVRCLESAKGNDSIAYLRFWFRDPTQDDPPDTTSTTSEDESDEEMTDITASEDDSESDAHPRYHNPNLPSSLANEALRNSERAGTIPQIASNGVYQPSGGESVSRESSGDSAPPGSTSQAIFGGSSRDESSASSYPHTPRSDGDHRSTPIELEAVISCTSDGLVVCLRRARPVMPVSAQPQVPTAPTYDNGIFAAPWAPEPLFVPALQQPRPPKFSCGPVSPSFSVNPGMRPVNQMSPAQHALMASIRDVAVFAWALTGINGSLADYSRGKPSGESLPPEGYSVWDPNNGDQSGSSSGYGSGSMSGPSRAPLNDAANKFYRP